MDRSVKECLIVELIPQPLIRVGLAPGTGLHCFPITIKAGVNRFFTSVPRLFNIVHSPPFFFCHCFGVIPPKPRHG